MADTICCQLPQSRRRELRLGVGIIRRRRTSWNWQTYKTVAIVVAVVTTAHKLEAIIYCKIPNLRSLTPPCHDWLYRLFPYLPHLSLYLLLFIGLPSRESPIRIFLSENIIFSTHCPFSFCSFFRQFGLLILLADYVSTRSGTPLLVSTSPLVIIHHPPSTLEDGIFLWAFYGQLSSDKDHRDLLAPSVGRFRESELRVSPSFHKSLNDWKMTLRRMVVTTMVSSSRNHPRMIND